MLTTLALAFLIDAAHATPHWGDFKDNGCVNPISAPGLRSYSAVLWGIPFGGSWEVACANMGATIDGVRYDNPALCVNAGVDSPLLFTFTPLADSDICKTAITIGAVLGQTDPSEEWKAACRSDVMGFNDNNLTRTVDFYEGPMKAEQDAARMAAWPVNTTLFGAVPAGAESGWREAVAGQVRGAPAVQHRQGAGGVNMWRVFHVPDERCLSTGYLALSDASHAQAAATCADQGMRLCTRDALCDGGAPVAGQLDGDVWVATGETDNSWVSLGTAYPERLCRSHVEVTGSEPSWGKALGPEPVTGKATAFRCCP